MLAALCALCLSVVPQYEHRVAYVDLIEYSHYRKNGNMVLEQLLFYEILDNNVYELRGWKLVTSGEHPARPPYFDVNKQRWVTVYWENSELHFVESLFFRETVSNHDVEIEERRNLPKEKRRPLFPVISP